MKPVSLSRHRFPADVIRYAAWLQFRFSLGSGDVEELPAQRGIEVSYDPIRCWRASDRAAARCGASTAVADGENASRSGSNPKPQPECLTTCAAIYNTFNIQRHLLSRPTLRRFCAEADAAWATAVS